MASQDGTVRQHLAPPGDVGRAGPLLWIETADLTGQMLAFSLLARASSLWQDAC